MFYNENYQTGVIETYQFLVNNVGDVEKYKDTSAFFLSRYSKYYHQESETLKNFLIFLDVSYILALIAYTITIIFMIKERIMDVVNYKAITITSVGLSQNKYIYIIKNDYFWKIVRGDDRKIFDTEIDMELEWAIKYKPGLVKYKDLHTISLLNFSEVLIKSSGGDIEMK